VERARIDIKERANTRALRALLEKIPEDNPESARARFDLALYDRDAVAADRALAALDNNALQGGMNLSIRSSRSFCQGLVARMKGDTEGMGAAFSAARAQHEEAVRAYPNEGEVLCGLGLIDAGLGRKEEALREGRLAVELLPLSKDAVNGADVLYIYAVICAWTGEHDLAIEQLNTLAQIPAGPSYGDLRLDPLWDPLRGDPRFEKIVGSLAPK
jgi:tetratricopeptide (TPR) repeat protein